MPKGDREKLKADPEDGTTPIANLLLEALIIANLTSKERAAVLFLIRRTYGWQVNGTRLKKDVIPLQIWVRVLQVKDTTRASRILTGLERKQVIKRESLGPGKSYCYTINTSIANWDNCLNKQLLSEMTTVALPKMTRVVLSQKTTPPATNLASPKERLKKVLNKEDITISSLEKDKQAEEIWEEALSQLKMHVSRGNYTTWLENTVGLSYREGQFFIGVPSADVAEHLNKSQYSLIERVVVGLTQPDTKIYFIPCELKPGSKDNAE